MLVSVSGALLGVGHPPAPPVPPRPPAALPPRPPLPAVPPAPPRPAVPPAVPPALPPPPLDEQPTIAAATTNVNANESERAERFMVGLRVTGGKSKEGENSAVAAAREAAQVKRKACSVNPDSCTGISVRP